MKVKGITWVEVIVILLMVIMFTVMGLGIYSQIANENNKISSGIVIDKDYNAAYTTTQYVNKTPIFIHHDEAWYFIIQGEKEDEIVEYRFEVDETTFNNYGIGDQYP